jgi:hypothetical protein
MSDECTNNSDTAEFRPKQRELARKLLIEKSRTNCKIPYTKLVSRREFASYSVPRLKVLFKNECRNIEDDVRRMKTSYMKKMMVEK